MSISRAISTLAGLAAFCSLPGSTQPASVPAVPPPVSRQVAADAATEPDATWALPAFEAAVGGRVHVLNTEHYRFYIAVDGGRNATDRVSELEHLWSLYEKTLASLVPLRERRGEVTVFIFATREELQRFAAAAPGKPAGRRHGLFWQRQPAFVAFDASAVLDPSDLGILFHAVIRVAHEVLLYEPGVVGSWWVREGFAVYFMQTQFDRQARFRPGEIRTSEGYIRDIAPGGRLSAGTVAAQEPHRALKAAGKSYRKRRHLPLRELLELTGDHVWPDAASREVASVEAWILVHFLLHAREGSLRPRPAAFLARERRGEGGADTFRRTVSRDLDVFEVFLYDHLNRMK